MGEQEMLSNLNENGAGEEQEEEERRAISGAKRRDGREFFQIPLFRPLNFYTVSPPHSCTPSPSAPGQGAEGTSFRVTATASLL